MTQKKEISVQEWLMRKRKLFVEMPQTYSKHEIADIWGRLSTKRAYRQGCIDMIDFTLSLLGDGVIMPDDKALHSCGGDK